MSGLDLSSPITGGAQTGFTNPTWTTTVDQAPSPNGKQDAVTASGGTIPAGVVLHSASCPATITRFKPQQIKLLGPANPVTGVIKNIPNNVHKVITRKGVKPAANQPAIAMPITTTIPVPAGVDTYDPDNLRAAISIHIGALNQLSAAIGNACVSNII